MIASRTGSIEKTIMEPVDGVSAGRTFALGNKRSLYDTILELGKNTTLLKQQALLQLERRRLRTPSNAI